MTNDAPNEPPKRKLLGRTVVIVAVAAVVFGPLAIGAAGYAFARMKRSELQAASVRAVTDLATGVARCSQPSRLVPPSTGLVPPNLPAGGRATTRADWVEPAFVCAGFHIEGLQKMQLEWTQTSPSRGTARATKSFSTAPLVVEIDVDCGDGEPACKLSPPRREGFVGE